VPGRRIRFGLALALVAVAGFAVGAYGAARGSAQDTLTSLTTTGPLTLTETVTEASTTLVTTTAPAPPTSAPATTAAPTTTATTAATTTAAKTSAGSTPWGWIALGAGLAAALLIGLLLWRRRRAGTASWRARAADLDRRCLVALDDVLDKGSVVTGQIEALAEEARSLTASAPDEAARAAAADVSARLDELVQALEADRRLRLGSPAPSSEQLSYSTSLIRQQVEQLQISLRRHSSGS
jgi:hypothetical protein